MGVRLVVEEVGVARVRIGEGNTLKLVVFKNALDSIRLKNSCLANTFKFRMCHFDGYEREEKKELIFVYGMWMGVRLVVEEVGVARVRIGEENTLKLLVFKNALDSIGLRSSCLANAVK